MARNWHRQLDQGTGCNKTAEKVFLVCLIFHFFVLICCSLRSSVCDRRCGFDGHGSPCTPAAGAAEARIPPFLYLSVVSILFGCAISFSFILCVFQDLFPGFSDKGWTGRPSERHLASLRKLKPIRSSTKKQIDVHLLGYLALIFLPSIISPSSSSQILGLLKIYKRGRVFAVGSASPPLFSSFFCAHHTFSMDWSVVFPFRCCVLLC